MWLNLLLVSCLWCTVTAQFRISETGFSDQYKSENTLGEYAFGYNEDHTSGGSFRRETGDRSGNKIGSYGLRVGDGRVRIVNYVADRNGFRADVFSNEPGLESQGSKNPFSTINKVDTHTVLVPGFRYSSTAPYLAFQGGDRQPSISETIHGHNYNEELGDLRDEDVVETFEEEMGQEEEDLPEDFDDTSYPERQLDSVPDTFKGKGQLSEGEYGYEESTNIDQKQEIEIPNGAIREMMSSQNVKEDSVVPLAGDSARNLEGRYYSGVSSTGADEDLPLTSAVTAESKESVVVSESRMNVTLSEIRDTRNETTTKVGKA